MKDASPYLDAREAAIHLHYTDDDGAPKMNAFYQFLHRRRRAGRAITTRRRGAVLLFLKSDLDASLTVEQATPARRGRQLKIAG